MNHEFVNLLLFAQAIFKASWMTGIGPGVVVMGLYNYRSHFVLKFSGGRLPFRGHIINWKGAA